MSYLLGELGLTGLDAEKVNFIYSGVMRGLSGNSIQSALKLSPLGGMRRATIQKVVRHIKGIKRASRYVKSVNYDKTLNPAKMSKSPYQHERNYNYIIKVTGKSDLTGARTEQNITITSDRLLTKAEALNYVDVDFPESESGEGITDYTAKVENVLLGGKYLE